MATLDDRIKAHALCVAADLDWYRFTTLEIAQCLGVDPKTAYDALKRLQKQKWVDSMAKYNYASKAAYGTNRQGANDTVGWARWEARAYRGHLLKTNSPYWDIDNRPD